MASKAKTIGHTGPGKPATVEERAGLLHSTREQEIRIRAHDLSVTRGTGWYELEDCLQAELEFTSQSRSELSQESGAEDEIRWDAK